MSSPSSAARAFVGLAGPPCADRWGAAGRCASYELRGLCHDGVAVAGLEANATEGCCACGRGGLREACPGAASEARTLGAARLLQGTQPFARHARLLQGVLQSPARCGFDAPLFAATVAAGVRLLDLFLTALVAAARRLVLLGLCARLCEARLPALEAFGAAEALLAERLGRLDGGGGGASAALAAAARRACLGGPGADGALQDGLVEWLLRARHAADVATAGMLGRYFGGPWPGALATARVVADDSVRMPSWRWGVLRVLLEGVGCASRRCDAVEVGVFAGQTSRHLLESLPLLRLHGVDPYAAEDEHPEANDAMYTEVASMYASFGSRATLHRNLSQSVAGHIGGPLDIVFLDGSHYSEAVWGDLVAWAPHTRRIAGHDMNMASWGVAHAVIRWSAGRTVHLLPDGVWYVDV